MHTPSELVDLEDVERCVLLLVELAKSLKEGDHGRW
jgi:endoglucanase